MNTKPLILLLIILCLGACRKDKCPAEPPSHPPSKPVNDLPVVKLRTMSVANLPSPWYQFTYNEEGYITLLNHSSGLMRYEIDYLNGRIRTLQANRGVPGNVNKDILRYTYTDSLATTIEVFDNSKQLYRIARLTYTPDYRLQQLTWQIDTGNTFVDEQTLAFSYFPDGNLRTIDFHQLPVGPFLDTRYTDHFEQYDNKENADGFALLHTPLHHPVLLPSIRLQRNNPGRYYRTGQGATFDARYTYTYDATGKPVLKTGPVTYKDHNGTTGQYQSVIDFTW